MEINLLVVDAGNTRLGVGVSVAGEVQFVKRFNHDDKDQWPDVIREAWAKVEGHEEPAIAGASVNPAAMEALEHVVNQITGHKVDWVGREIDLPVRVLTEPPAETRVDRVVSVPAAFEQLGKASVVVSAGTPITGDRSNHTRHFLGYA